MNVSHEWSEDGQCSIAVQNDVPNWEFSVIEMVGIAVKWVGGVFSVTSQACSLVGLELQAAAEYRRAQRQEAKEAYQQEVARAEMAGSLEGLVFFDDFKGDDA